MKSSADVLRRLYVEIVTRPEPELVNGSGFRVGAHFYCPLKAPNADGLHADFYLCIPSPTPSPCITHMAKLVVYDPSKTGAGLSKRQVEVQFLVLDAFEWVGDSPRGQIGFTLNSTQMGFDVSDVTDPWVGTCLDIMRRARELAMGDDLPG